MVRCAEPPPMAKAAVGAENDIFGGYCGWAYCRRLSRDFAVIPGAVDDTAGRLRYVFKFSVRVILESAAEQSAGIRPNWVLKKSAVRRCVSNVTEFPQPEIVA